MKRLITIALLTLGILVGCKSVEYVTPELPEYSVTVPVRPVLTPVDGDMPKEAVDNFLTMVSYAVKLEVIIDGWAEFYEGLRNVQHSVE